MWQAGLEISNGIVWQGSTNHRWRTAHWGCCKCTTGSLLDSTKTWFELVGMIVSQIKGYTAYLLSKHPIWHVSYTHSHRQIKRMMYSTKDSSSFKTWIHIIAVHLLLGTDCENWTLACTLGLALLNIWLGFWATRQIDWANSKPESGPESQPKVCSAALAWLWAMWLARCYLLVEICHFLYFFAIVFADIEHRNVNDIIKSSIHV